MVAVIISEVYKALFLGGVNNQWTQEEYSNMEYHNYLVKGF